jgi:hypothetical protein
VYVLLLLALSATFGKAASRFQKTECPAPASQNLGNINTFSYIPPIDGKVLRWFDYPNLAIVLGSGVAWTMMIYGSFILLILALIFGPQCYCLTRFEI